MKQKAISFSWANLIKSLPSINCCPKKGGDSHCWVLLTLLYAKPKALGKTTVQSFARVYGPVVDTSWCWIKPTLLPFQLTT